MADIIDDMRTKYANHEFMKQKLENYLSNLPTLMKTIEDGYNLRLAKKEQISIEREAFIIEFLDAFYFIYIPQTDMYIDTCQAIVSEDFIIHLICTKLNKSLFASRHKITQTIIKRLRENIVSQVTTCPKLGEIELPFDAEQAIYFLTIVGDILLNKREALTFFIDTSYKPFLKQLNQSIYCTLNKSVVDKFKHKYHDHKYETSRIIMGTCPHMERPITQEIPVIMAAISLSNKYSNSDGYLATMPSLEYNAMYLSRHTQDSLAAQFMAIFNKTNGTLMYKDIYFIWKLFLRKQYLPLVIPQQTFKTIISDTFGDECVSVQSDYMPFLHTKQFIDKYISYDDNGSYDISELVKLCNGIFPSITDDMMRLVLQMENITIDKSTAINISCSIWIKSHDIDVAMENFKHHHAYSLDINEFYKFYITYTKRNKKMSVSRQNFEEIVSSDIH